LSLSGGYFRFIWELSGQFASFVGGVGAGFYNLSMGVKYLGEPAPCILKERVSW
jgi:hypothetical protein